MRPMPRDFQASWVRLAVPQTTYYAVNARRKAKQKSTRLQKTKPSKTDEAAGATQKQNDVRLDLLDVRGC